MIVLDTHVLIWLATDASKVGRRSRAAYDRAIAGCEAAVSVVGYWELGMLAARGRLGAAHAPMHYRQKIQETAIVGLPLTGDIAILASNLEALQGDPADRFIAATAVVHGGTLITADRTFLKWKSNLPRQDASL